MNITLGSGKAVHIAHIAIDGETTSLPECGGNRASERYRTTTREVTCKKCLKWQAAEQDRRDRTAYYAGVAESQDMIGSQAEAPAEVYVSQQPEVQDAQARLSEAMPQFKEMEGTVRTDSRGLKYRVNRVSFKGARRFNAATVVVSGTVISEDRDEFGVTVYGAYASEIFYDVPAQAEAPAADAYQATRYLDSLIDLVDEVSAEAAKADAVEAPAEVPECGAQVYRPHYGLAYCVKPAGHSRWDGDKGAEHRGDWDAMDTAHAEALEANESHDRVESLPALRNVSRMAVSAVLSKAGNARWDGHSRIARFAGHNVTQMRGGYDQVEVRFRAGGNTDHLSEDDLTVYRTQKLADYQHDLEAAGYTVELRHGGLIVTRRR